MKRIGLLRHFLLCFLTAVAFVQCRRISLTDSLVHSEKTRAFLRNSDGSRTPLTIFKGGRHCEIPKQVKCGLYDLYIEEEAAAKEGEFCCSFHASAAAPKLTIIPVYIPPEGKDKAKEDHEIRQLSFDYDEDAVDATGKIIFLHINKKFAKEIFGNSFEFSKDGKKSIYFDSSASDGEKFGKGILSFCVLFLFAILA